MLKRVLILFVVVALMSVVAVAQQKPMPPEWMDVEVCKFVVLLPKSLLRFAQIDPAPVPCRDRYQDGDIRVSFEQYKDIRPFLFHKAPVKQIKGSTDYWTKIYGRKARVVSFSTPSGPSSSGVTLTTVYFMTDAEYGKGSGLLLTISSDRSVPPAAVVLIYNSVHTPGQEFVEKPRVPAPPPEHPKVKIEKP